MPLSLLNTGILTVLFSAQVPQKEKYDSPEVISRWRGAATKDLRRRTLKTFDYYVKLWNS